MKNKKIMKITDNLGNIIEYEILASFISTITKKNYVIYTDNTLTSTNNLNVYAAIYDPDDDTKLEEIKTKEEWQEIEYFIANHLS